MLSGSSAFALAPDYQYDERRKIEAPTERQKKAAHDLPLSILCADIANHENGAHDRKNQSQSEPSPKSDLCQQWRMAEAAEEMANWSRLQMIALWIEVGLVAIATLAAVLAAKWAKHAARAGRTTVTIAHKALTHERISAKRSQRAYMFIAPGPIRYGSRPYIRVNQGNSGQTPARGVLFSATATVLRHPLPESQPFATGSITQGEYTMTAGSAHFIQIPAFGVSKNDLIRTTKDGSTERLYVFCEMKYFDVFGDCRYVRASWYYELSESNVNKDLGSWFDSVFYYTDENNFVDPEVSNYGNVGGDVSETSN